MPKRPTLSRCVRMRRNELGGKNAPFFWEFERQASEKFLKQLQVLSARHPNSIQAHSRLRIPSFGIYPWDTWTYIYIYEKKIQRFSRFPGIGVSFGFARTVYLHYIFLTYHIHFIKKEMFGYIRRGRENKSSRFFFFFFLQTIFL